MCGFFLVLRSLLGHLTNTIIQVNADFLLLAGGVTFVFFILIMRTDLKQEKSMEKLLSKDIHVLRFAIYLRIVDLSLLKSMEKFRTCDWCKCFDKKLNIKRNCLQFNARLRLPKTTVWCLHENQYLRSLWTQMVLSSMFHLENWSCKNKRLHYCKNAKNLCR